MKKYKYTLDPSSRKFICPNCTKKRFVKYVDAVGNYLTSEFGRCDRINECAYFKKPNDGDFNSEILVPIPTVPSKPPSFIKREVYEASMSAYERNSFFIYLTKVYDQKQIDYAFRKYNIGTANIWNGSSIFWQKDRNGRFRSGKVMKFDPNTGRRVTNPRALITWVHTLLKLRNFNLKQVLFGIHLVDDMPAEGVICIVESEKTAVVCSIECPEFTWIATGSIQLFKTETIRQLKHKKIIVFPDTDAHELWKEKADEISNALNTAIHVSDFLINTYIDHNIRKGFDLADMFFKDHGKAPEVISEVQKVLNRMIKKNPAIKVLIERLNLDTDNAKLEKGDMD